MPYMLMIVEPAGQRRTVSEDEGRARYERMLRFGGDLTARGLLSTSQSLHSEAEGVRVQVRAGKRSLVDGPFSESKEMVGGFFMLDCATKEQAVAIACECPAIEWATVEVREIGPCFN